MEAFRFYSWLWLLLIPIAIAIVVWRAKRSRQAAAVFSSISDLKGLPITFPQRIHRALPYLYGIGLCLLLAALCAAAVWEIGVANYGRGNRDRTGPRYIWFDGSGRFSDRWR